MIKVRETKNGEDRFVHLTNNVLFLIQLLPKTGKTLFNAKILHIHYKSLDNIKFFVSFNLLGNCLTSAPMEQNSGIT